MTTLFTIYFLPDQYHRPWTYNLPSGPVGPFEPQTPSLESAFRYYTTSQGELQTLKTPSGNLQTGGLNEPKYEIDGRPFTGAWGRPQRYVAIPSTVSAFLILMTSDGPALRALAIIPYAHYLLDRGYPADRGFVQEHLYNPRHIRHAGNVIKNDLEEVASGWYKEGFDLWEEM